jgi:hypothetical protein
MNKQSKGFWDTRRVVAYSVSEDVRRYVVYIHYLEPFRGDMIRKSMVAFIPKH